MQLMAQSLAYYFKYKRNIRGWYKKMNINKPQIT